MRHQAHPVIVINYSVRNQRKNAGIFLFFSFLFSFCCLSVNAQKLRYTDLSYQVCPHYKYRADGEAGREIILRYAGEQPVRNASLQIFTPQGNEVIKLKSLGSESPVLLPARTGVSQTDTVRLVLTVGKEQYDHQIEIPAMRHWIVYIYPHSHVDIGYTNTQENVEVIHKRNLEHGIRLAKETKDYPEGARFVWNPEVTWPVERYLHSASPVKRKELLDAIREGYIRVDAGYVSTNTSASGDEELYEMFRYGKELEKQTGQAVKTIVQVDIPGISWGTVEVAAQMKIPYILCLFNGTDRVGNAWKISFRPFWWQSPDGQSKVLFLQPGAYTPGAHNKGHMFWPKMAGQTDTTKLMQIVKTDNPRNNFIDPYLANMLPTLEKADYYPYDIFPMTWCMADNTPIDADLPEAVKSWNEEFAYPRLHICGATEMMQVFEEKYGDQLPVVSGDFTEYWTDGLGSAAKYTASNRVVKERLIQTETLWSMLSPTTAFPREKMEDAWQNVILGTEHTWAYMRPDQQPLSDEILSVKLGRFETAARISEELLAETVARIEKKDSPCFAVFNTHSWAHDGIVTLPAGQSGSFDKVTDEQGNELISQRLSTGELIFKTGQIPPFNCRKYYLSTQKKKKKSGSGFVKDLNTLDNDLVKVTVDPATGDVSSLIYAGMEYVDAKALPSLNSYRYLYGNDSPGKALKAENNRLTIKEDGPLVATLAVHSDAEGCHSLVREVTVRAGSPQVDFSNELDKVATKTKEGIHFGFAFDIPQPVVRADIPWGIMELEKDQMPEGNRNWIAFQRWLSIGNADKSITWCSPDACMFENGDITANILGGAYKSPEWLQRLKPASTIYSWALNNHWHTNFPLSQEGKIRFRYHLLPQEGAYEATTSNRFGTEQIQPLIPVAVDPSFSYSPNLSLTDNPAIVVSIIKTVNEGQSCIIRFRSISDKEETFRLEWLQQSPKSLTRCTDYEEAGEPLQINQSIAIAPKGSVTLRMEW